MNGVTKENPEEIKKRFPTYEKAIAAIILLDHALRSDRQALTVKNRLGRPPKEIKLPALSRILMGGARGGRPVKITKGKMLEILQKWEDFKRDIASQKNKKSVTDKEAIEYFIENNMKNESLQKKNALRREAQSRIKYFRDTTGIRQKQKKRKTP